MGHRILARKANGQFRRMLSLKEMGFDVADSPKQCQRCGYEWNPILNSTPCPKCKQDARNGD